MAAGIVKDLGHGDLADVAAPDAFDCLLEHRARAALEVYPEAEALALGLLTAREELLGGRHVHGDGLAQKTCLPASTAAAACIGWK
jgi:hypothetical protein